MTMLFPGITYDVCDLALNIQVPAFKRAFEMGVARRFAGTFVVMAPHAQASSPHPSLDEVEAAALIKRRIDPQWPEVAKYDEIALSKAAVLWGLRPVLGPNFTTRDVQQGYPHLYLPGMVKYGGGVCQSGVIYAFSGVQANYDEAFALSVAAWVEAMCREAMVDPDAGVMNENGPRVGIDTTRTMASYATHAISS